MSVLVQLKRPYCGHYISKLPVLCSSFSTRISLSNSQATSNSVFDDDDKDYLKRRLAQLAEEARPIKEDPLAGKVSGIDNLATISPDEISSDSHALTPEQQQVLAKIARNLEKNEQKAFLYQNQRAHAIASKIPSYTPKQSLDIAINNPWNGAESNHDLVNRMLNDAHKPLKGDRTGGRTKLGVSGITGGIPIPKMSGKVGRPMSRMEISSRLSDAREKSLDYEIHHKHALDKNKSKPPIHNAKKSSDTASSNFEHEDGSTDGPSFREMYKDRFIGPTSFAADLSAINSLASQRIEDAIARGEFQGIKRGTDAVTSLETSVKFKNGSTKKVQDHNLSSPYIDTTEYFLNKIIKQQGAAPIWIDKQGSLKLKIENFRKEMVNSWVTHMVHVIDSNIGTERMDESAKSSKIEHARKYAELVKTKTKFDVAVHHTTSTIDLLDLRESDESSKRATVPVSQRYVDASFESKQASYLEAAISSINSSIRSYNLQAPGVARWSYLQLPQELQLSYRTGSSTLVDAMKRFVGEKTEADILREKEQEERLRTSGKNFKLPDSKTDTMSAFQWGNTELLYEEKSDLASQFKGLFKFKLY